MNPIMQLINQNNSNNNQTNNLFEVLTLISQIRNSSNPQQAALNMIQTDPRGKEIMSMLNASSSPKALALQMMKERGINPEDILSRIK